MTLNVTSHAFKDGEEIPKVYSCDGESRSVPLSWSQGPSGTQSYAVICDDPDAPGGTFSHWAIYNIPADRHQLNESLPTDPLLEGMAQAKNDFGKFGYGPPCPPEGHGTHRYYFRVYALDAPKLELAQESSVPQVEAAVKQHVLDMGQIMGTYVR